VKVLARPVRAVAGHGPGTHAESGHEGRRDAVERGTALVAAFLGSVAQPQPLAAGHTLSIQALDRTARQSVHQNLRFAAAMCEKQGVNERDSAPKALVSQEKYPLLVGVHFRKTCAAVFFDVR
jgi:hypothetical protein